MIYNSAIISLKTLNKIISSCRRVGCVGSAMVFGVLFKRISDEKNRIGCAAWCGAMLALACASR
jgi:hypothetical protein